MGCCCSKGKQQTSHEVNSLFDSAGVADIGDGRKVIRVTEEDDPRLEEVIDVTARAFCGTESTPPFAAFHWVYDPKDPATGLQPLAAAPSAERSGWFRFSLKLTVLTCLPFGGVYAVVDTASNKVIAAALTNPPSKTYIHEIGTCALMALFSKMGSVPPPGMDGFNPLERAMKNLHKKTISGRHLYVLGFATDPDVQSRGTGTALLKFLNTIADADGVDAYLETCGERSLAFYSRKGGYERKGSAPIKGKDRLFDAEGGLHAMVRPARAGLV